MKAFFDKAAMQNHPLRFLLDFLEQEKAFEQANKYDDMKFVGYALDIGYDTVTIITCDPYKIAVGGVPRNSILIMIPSNYEEFPPHFTLLRVADTAPTPLSKEVQQTYFELQKKSMPELDIFTQSELQWGALKTSVLGMIYPHPDKFDQIEFSGDLNNFVSAHKYRVYAPNKDLLDLIINSLVPKDNQFSIGNLRLTECRLPLPDKPLLNIPVMVAPSDFMGTRTAMFGKTRLGKSNVVKLIAQSLIETTQESKNVGQIIFDINGEYANDNPQDENLSLASVYKDRCEVYALTPKPSTPSKPLKLNFYEFPDRSHQVLGSLLVGEGRSSIYVKDFIGAEIPSLQSLASLPANELLRAKRRILMYWSILMKGGFAIDEGKLTNGIKGIDPKYNADLRSFLYPGKTPPNITSLHQLVSEFEHLADFIRNKKDDNPLLSSSSGSKRPLFERDERALLEFLKPSAGKGPAMLTNFRMYHDQKAGDFSNEILALIDDGKTVILDLGNANPVVMEYFSEELSHTIFNEQVTKFSNNNLGNHYVQLYFEEAHNLFPVKEEKQDIYKRIAKEGAKYHIGMVYSTQSVTTVNKDLLSQTENFFIAHLSSQDEVNALGKVNFAYNSLKDDILQSKTVGYIRMLTRSHRFVIPIQARKFEPLKVNN
ncbi:MAG: ATP-binding protein [Desulfobaccales bacterium]